MKNFVTIKFDLIFVLISTKLFLVCPIFFLLMWNFLMEAYLATITE